MKKLACLFVLGCSILLSACSLDDVYVVLQEYNLLESSSEEDVVDSLVYSSSVEVPVDSDTYGLYSSGEVFVPTTDEYHYASELYGIEWYTGDPWVVVNDNIPLFDISEYSEDYVFEDYSYLDDLGRCGVAFANICEETMPTEERGDISQVKPSGWVSAKYDCVSGKYLYNRCHLIGYQLAGENDNELNLITGTRYLNIDGMLGFENEVAEYVEDTGNHVLYRVTPIFTGDNLVSDGVLMEAYSLEDSGEGVEFCVFVYNVQPGIDIDYATGNSCLNYEDY